MIKMIDFEKKHIEQARKIAELNYSEERACVAELPNINIPDLEDFADNGLGVVIEDCGDMLGYLCCYEPWDNAFDSTAKGIFSPIHAHGAVLKNREKIYKKLYQSAAEKWVKSKITYHAVSLYAHDNQAVNAFFNYGFGLRCIDSVRPLIHIDCSPYGEAVFGEIEQTEAVKIREMRILLSRHMRKSPCFMYSPESAQTWLTRAESRDSRLFTATVNEKPIAFIEAADGGENFVTESGGIKNICGAFCYPEYRGKGIVQGLLNYIISTLKAEGYDSLGVDFESFNPTANGFWLKHFSAYTKSVTRRIDECALQTV
jgi:GNAT superfamily N-acetyltransferase